MPRDLRIKALVIRRTDFGEADRILTLLTEEGIKSAIARGVKKAKSKLAAGVEMFTLTEVTLHEGKGGLATVTSAQMKEFFGGILGSYERLDESGKIMKDVGKIAEHVNSEQLFFVLYEALKNLDRGVSVVVVRMWVEMNLRLVVGEEVNLLRDTNGEKLSESEKYDWEPQEQAFRRSENGRFAVEHIKFLRLAASVSLSTLVRVKDASSLAGDVAKIFVS
jgi:DNA repair protein RecO (recombination protein O)